MVRIDEECYGRQLNGFEFMACVEGLKCVGLTGKAKERCIQYPFCPGGQYADFDWTMLGDGICNSNSECNTFWRLLQFHQYHHVFRTTCNYVQVLSPIRLGLYREAENVVVVAENSGPVSPLLFIL